MAQAYELGLSDYWRILRKQSRVILGCVLLCATVTAFYLSRQHPIYRATAQIKLERARMMSGQFYEGFQSYYENPMVTESRVIESRSIAEVVVRAIEPELEKTNPDKFQDLAGEIQGSISAEPVNETNIIKILSTGGEPKRVAQVANLTAEAYIAFNLDERNKQARKVREFVESQIGQTEVRLKVVEEALKQMRAHGDASGQAVALQNRLADIQGQLMNLQPKLKDVHPDILRLKAQVSEIEGQLQGLPAAELEYARLSREVQVNEKTYRTLRERLEEARIAEAEKVAEASIIERATPPGSPVGFKKKLGMFLGLMLGLLVGAMMAFVIETLDTSIGTIDDVESLLQVPVLAVIPHFGYVENAPVSQMNFSWRRLFGKHDKVPDERYTLFAHYNPRSPATEAYRILRTNLKLAPERKVLLVTSAGPGEGKSTLISNLGIVIAQAGLRVVLVSSDLRRPQLGRLFDLPRDQGLSEVLRGDLAVERSIRGLSDFILGKFGYEETIKNPYLANLFVITSGKLPENPAELLGSANMQATLEKLRSQYDVVLVDAPPILPVADALLLAPQVDGVMLVYEVGRISRAALGRAKGQLDSVGARILGVVLNHVRPEVQTQPRDYYYYRQKYAYSDKDTKETKVAEPGATTPDLP